MKNTLEKKLYKNLIIIILLIIISIAVSIALLSGIITELTKLKDGSTDIVIKIQDIAVSQNLKTSYLKDTILSYGNSKKFNSYLSLYKNEKKILNYQMRKVEKKIASLEPKDKKIIGDLYINLYNIIKKNIENENEIINNLKTSDFQTAMKTYKLTYKNDNKEFLNAIKQFYNLVKEQTKTIETVAKGKITFVLIINSLTFIIFLIVAIIVISSISKHIIYLHKSVAKIKNGEYTETIVIESDDELAELATALDRMRQSFLKSLTRLQRNR